MIRRTAKPNKRNGKQNCAWLNKRQLNLCYRACFVAFVHMELCCWRRFSLRPTGNRLFLFGIHFLAVELKEINCWWSLLSYLPSHARAAKSYGYGYVGIDAEADQTLHGIEGNGLEFHRGSCLRSFVFHRNSGSNLCSKSVHQVRLRSS